MALAAIATVGLAWIDDVPEITSAEAVRGGRTSLAAAGVEATVDDRPSAERYSSRAQRTTDVWRVRVMVRDAPVDIYLARNGAQPVSIDDRNQDGSAYVLSEAEYDAVAAGVVGPCLGPGGPSQRHRHGGRRPPGRRGHPGRRDHPP